MFAHNLLFRALLFLVLTAVFTDVYSKNIRSDDIAVIYRNDGYKCDDGKTFEFVVVQNKIIKVNNAELVGLDHGEIALRVNLKVKTNEVTPFCVPDRYLKYLRVDVAYTNSDSGERGTASLADLDKIKNGEYIVLRVR